MELSLTGPRFVEKLFFFLAWIGTATAVASILYFYHTAPFPTARLEYIADQLHNAVFGAIIYGMIVLIIYFYIMKKTPGRKRRWLYGMMAAIVAGSVVLTQSRGPLGILLITFIVGGVLTRDFKLLIVLACIIILGATLFIKNDSIQKAVTQRGLSYRIELAEKTVNMIKGDVFFGKGITTDQQIRANDGFLLYHPHNVYLGMVLYGGLAALFIFLLLLAMAFRESLRHYLLTGDIILLALLLFGAGNILIDQDKVITHPGPFWFFFWLPLALTAGIAAQKSEAPD
jgi:O-antigen ligase